MLTTKELAAFEADEVAYLRLFIEGAKGEKALRDMLLAVIQLPRRNIFGSIIIQSGALRRAITGEVLSESHHSPLPDGTRLYEVSYRKTPRGGVTSRRIIARDDKEAVRKLQATIEFNRERLFRIIAVTPLIHEVGYVHVNKESLAT